MRLMPRGAPQCKASIKHLNVKIQGYWAVNGMMRKMIPQELNMSMILFKMIPQESNISMILFKILSIVMIREKTMLFLLLVIDYNVYLRVLIRDLNIFYHFHLWFMVYYEHIFIFFWIILLYCATFIIQHRDSFSFGWLEKGKRET